MVWEQQHRIQLGSSSICGRCMRLARPWKDAICAATPMLMLHAFTSTAMRLMWLRSHASDVASVPRTAYGTTGLVCIHTSCMLCLLQVSAKYSLRCSSARSS